MIEALTLDQLRVLVEVADRGSFSAAARHLGRVQSAISRTVNVLEETQGVELFDRSGYRPHLTPTGRSLVDHARQVLAAAARFQAVAAATRAGLEAELQLSLDPLVPSEPFMASLSALRERYPNLPVAFSTEGLGGSLRRIRDDPNVLAICVLLPTVPDDVAAYPLDRFRMVPVVSAEHPLASLDRPTSQSDLSPFVQLVLSDPVDASSENYGLTSAHLWRFVDLRRRLDFLHGGFGWCRMPEHLISQSLADGGLVELAIEQDVAPSDPITVYAAHRRDGTLGPAGRWLLEDLRQRVGPTSRA